MGRWHKFIKRWQVSTDSLSHLNSHPVEDDTFSSKDDRWALTGFHTFNSHPVEGDTCSSKMTGEYCHTSAHPVTHDMSWTKDLIWHSHLNVNGSFTPVNLPWIKEPLTGTVNYFCPRLHCIYIFHHSYKRHHACSTDVTEYSLGKKWLHTCR